MSESIPQYTKGQLYQLKMDDLQSDPNQPRKYFDSAALEDLVNSIKTQGVLQPVLFRVDKDGKLFIVAGERRFQAANEAGLDTIPGILVEGNHEEIALVENLLRQDLTALELSEALCSIMKKYGYTQEQLTTIIGKAKSTVSEILSLDKLPNKIKDACRKDPTIPRNVLIKIAKKKREKGMTTAFMKFVEMKEARETSTRKRRGKSTFQTRFTSKFDKMKTFMTDINLGKLDAAAQNDLTSLVEGLKKAADDFLKQIKKAPAMVKTPPVVKPNPKKETTKKKPVKTVTKSKANKS